MKEILDKYGILPKEAGLSLYAFESEEVQLEIVKQNGYCIRFIHNPSEAVQLAAVKRNCSAIGYIKNPSEEAQLEAVKQNGTAIEYIHNPSEVVQLEAVKEAGVLFANTTSESTIEYFCKNLVMKKALE